MATIESATDVGTKLRVDPLFGAARVGLRPFDAPVSEGQAVGHYALGLRSGAMTSAAVTADTPVFSLRWTSASKRALITRLEAFYVPVVTFTAMQEIGVGLRKLTAYSAVDAGGTAIDLSAGLGRVDERMPVSVMDDMRIATTGVVTAGTRTRGAHAIASGSGAVNVINAAAATEYLNPGPHAAGRYGFAFEADMGRGESPLVLNPNEGLAVENLVIFPAAGVARLFVNLAWVEAP